MFTNLTDYYALVIKVELSSRNCSMLVRSTLTKRGTQCIIQWNLRIKDALGPDTCTLSIVERLSSSWRFENALLLWEKFFWEHCGRPL